MCPAPTGEGTRPPGPPRPRRPSALTSPHGPHDAAGGVVPHGQPCGQLAQLHVHQLHVLEGNCGKERERDGSVSGRDGGGRVTLSPRTHPAAAPSCRCCSAPPRGTPGRDAPLRLMGGRGGCGEALAPCWAGRALSPFFPRAAPLGSCWSWCRLVPVLSHPWGGAVHQWGLHTLPQLPQVLRCVQSLLAWAPQDKKALGVLE